MAFKNTNFDAADISYTDWSFTDPRGATMVRKAKGLNRLTGVDDLDIIEQLPREDNPDASVGVPLRPATAGGNPSRSVMVQELLKQRLESAKRTSDNSSLYSAASLVIDGTYGTASKKKTTDAKPVRLRKMSVLAESLDLLR